MELLHLQFPGAVGQPVGAVWINGKRYLNASEMLHVRGDSVEIALSAFKEGINYFAIEGAAQTVTFQLSMYLHRQRLLRIRL